MRGRGTLVLRDAASRRVVLQEKRLSMLAILSGPAAVDRGGYTVTELGELLGCTTQNAHHHVKALERVGAARVARVEPTQRIPRQFWVSDLRWIELHTEGGGQLRILLVPEADGSAGS